VRIVVATLMAAMLVGVTAKPVCAADDPLSRVPPSAGLFAHLRVAEIWNSPLGKEIRKGAGKKLDKALAELQKEIGISIDNIDTATFFYPTLPQGDGDEVTFVVIATTVKPYDRNALMSGLRKKDAQVKNNLLQLDDGFKLCFASDTMFMVMHDSLVEKFAAGPIVDKQPAVIAEALKLARDKHHFVIGMDFSKLPNEVFTTDDPEVLPFLPLLKAKTSAGIADLKGAELTFGANLVAANADAAAEAERSFKLLIKLALDGLAEAQNDSDVKTHFGPLMPLLKDLRAGLNGIKSTRNKDRLEISLTLKTEQRVGDLVGEFAKTFTKRADRSVTQNNLKQIALAMHVYHDEHQAFPPAAICDKKGKPLLSWRVAILPYVEQQGLYEKFKLDEPWDSEHNRKLIEIMPKLYASGADKAPGKTHFRVFHSNDAVFDVLQPSRLQDITDGTSNTVMVVETVDGCEWTKPDDIAFNNKLEIEKLLRFVDNQTTVAFCDGSVRAIKKGKGDKFWRLLVQKNDGEVIKFDE
jgi:hypothetical protein